MTEQITGTLLMRNIDIFWFLVLILYSIDFIY